MALINARFTNCFSGTGPAIQKTFEIESTGGWVANQSYVIYSGDGGCYSYSFNGGGAPVQTFLVPDGTNVTGACNSLFGCPTVNLDTYPNNLYYTFSACCDGSTFSFRRGDVGFGPDYIDGIVFLLNYSGTGGTFNGCATVITGYTGTTIYVDPSPIYGYSTFGDCATC